MSIYLHGSFIYFGDVAFDEQGYFSPQPNGFKMQVRENLNGTRTMEFIYID